jgi:hypothetical protein
MLALSHSSRTSSLTVRKSGWSIRKVGTTQLRIFSSARDEVLCLCQDMNAVSGSVVGAAGRSSFPHSLAPSRADRGETRHESVDLTVVHLSPLTGLDDRDT